MTTDSSKTFREYACEDGEEVDREKLTAGFLDREIYAPAHAGLIISCHDVYVEMEGENGSGFLLIQRDNVPAKGILWPLGGKIRRGIPTVDSLKAHVQDEAKIQLDDIRYLGTGRTLFQTDPFGHGRGTDTINLVYSARGYGEPELDELHSKPTIVTPAEYSGIRETLHPYVQEFMDLLCREKGEEINQRDL